jgi:hypothetical protein
MPIEIKELHIKINLEESPESREISDREEADTDKIIEACVEQVMEILRKKEER